jgi:hypothetical protein
MPEIQDRAASRRRPGSEGHQAVGSIRSKDVYMRYQVWEPPAPEPEPEPEPPEPEPTPTDD